MSSDYHAKFDDVKGESDHKNHKGEIALLSWEWDVGQASSAAAGTGSGKGKASPGAFSFVHNYDKSSPVLAQKCVKGEHFKEVKIAASKATGSQEDYLIVTMKEVFITAVRPGASAGGDIAERVSCTYKDIEFAYKPQDEKGSLGGEIKFGWNVASTEVR